MTSRPKLILLLVMRSSLFSLKKASLDEEGFVNFPVVSCVEDEISDEVLEKAWNKTLTKQDLNDIEITIILRWAHRNSFVAQLVNSEFDLRPLPFRPGFRLLPHQIECLGWMRQREAMNQKGIKGGIVRFNMGLGKTAMAYSLSLTSAAEEWPTLVVCSKTVLNTWREEHLKFFGALNVKVFLFNKTYLGPKMNDVTLEVLKDYDFVVTTYDTCMSVCRKCPEYIEEILEYGDDHSLMKDKVISIHPREEPTPDPKVKGPALIYEIPWSRVFCDESQRFANPTTQTFRVIMAVYGKYKWCLTGTPIRNYDTDIWAQFRFLGYDGVVSAVEWKKKSSVCFQMHNLQQCIFSMDYKGANIELPPKYEQTLSVTLRDKQRQCYEMVLGMARVAFDQLMAGLCSFSCILAVFIRLRQACIAPFLMTDKSKRSKEKRVKGDEDILVKMNENIGSLGAWVYDRDGTAGAQSAKISLAIDTIARIPVNEKVLVFSSFTSCLDLMEYALEKKYPHIKSVMLDGDTTGEDRQQVLSRFRNDPSVKVFFISYKVGSEGLNLTIAPNVICCEPWWTPAVHNQAIARAWRTGQTKEVKVYNIIAEDTIEQKVLDICHDKDELAEMYLDGSRRKVKKHGGLDKYSIGRILGKWKW